MLKNTFIARASDGLILCETYDSVTDSQSKKAIQIRCIVEKLKHNAKSMMNKLGA